MKTKIHFSSLNTTTPYKNTAKKIQYIGSKDNTASTSDSPYPTASTNSA